MVFWHHCYTITSFPHRSQLELAFELEHVIFGSLHGVATGSAHRIQSRVIGRVDEKFLARLQLHLVVALLENGIR